MSTEPIQKIPSRSKSKPYAIFRSYKATAPRDSNKTSKQLINH